MVEGVPAVTRRTRVLNRSSVDIRLDWRTFNVSADDRQLVDLLVIYGDPFPLRDSAGNEIIVQCDNGESFTEDALYKHLPADERLVSLPIYQERVY